jgi:hypothetical protein
MVPNEFGGGKERMRPDPNDEKSNKRPQSMIGVGVAIGAALGVALGTALDNIAIGVALGLSLGAGLGVILDEQRRRKE